MVGKTSSSTKCDATQVLVFRSLINQHFNVAFSFQNSFQGKKSIRSAAADHASKRTKKTTLLKSLLSELYQCPSTYSLTVVRFLGVRSNPKHKVLYFTLLILMLLRAIFFRIVIPLIMHKDHMKFL